MSWLYKESLGECCTASGSKSSLVRLEIGTKYQETKENPLCANEKQATKKGSGNTTGLKRKQGQRESRKQKEP